MNLEKVSAERDALLHALKHAEEEITKARAGQKQAEARLAESHMSRTPMIVPAAALKTDGNSAALAQAHAAQKRAETMACTLEEQLQGQKAELEQFRATMASLKTDNEQLRKKIAELEEQKSQPKQTDSASPIHVNRNEVRSLREELEICRVEIQRLRTLVVKVASEARGGTVPADLLESPKRDPKAAMAAARHTPLPTAPSKTKADVDTTPRSGVHRAA